MFSNMKIGMRLGLGFGAVLLMLVLSSWQGLARMGTVNDSSGKIVR